MTISIPTFLMGVVCTFAAEGFLIFISLLIYSVRYAMNKHRKDEKNG